MATTSSNNKYTGGSAKPAAKTFGGTAPAAPGAGDAELHSGAGEPRARRPGKPNPWKMDDFLGKAEKVVVQKKANKERETPLEKFAELSVVRGSWGVFLSSGTDETEPRYTISTKKEIPVDGNLAKCPIAYLAVQEPQADSKRTLCNLFQQMSQSTGAKYLKGTDRETGEVYLVFLQDKKD